MKPYLLCSLLLALTSVVSAQSTAFTYQGHLMDAGASANGNYDLQFTLKNALTAGSTVGTPQVISPVNAVNGIFTVTLDFGSTPFDGTDRWVELGVRPAGSIDPYTVLAPRQRITATPYALKALSATNATNLTGTVTAGNIAAGTITGAMISGGSMTDSQISPSAAISATKLASGLVDNTELGYLNGVTQPLQGQLDGKVSKSGDTMTGTLVMDNSSGVAFRDADSSNSAFIGAPLNLSSSYVLRLPSAQGLNGQLLNTDSSGTLSWVTGATPSGTAGGILTGTYPNPSIAAGTITGAMIAPGAAITTSTAAPVVSLVNSTDNASALSFVSPFRTWRVGQNKPPDLPGATDQFFIHDQNSNTTRLRIDLTGVIYGNGGGLTGVAASTVGGVSAANVASGANLANAATTANTPNTLVMRDASGSIPASAVATPPPGMVLIPAGAFTMGNSIAADTDITNAAPVSTTVSAFYMDVNEVSLSQWQSVYYWATSNGYAFTNAGAGKGANHPVQTVDWYDVVKWCNARSEQAGKTPVYYTNDAQTSIYKTGNVNVTNAQLKWTANGYRLPTEAEWEKAARGGRSGQRFPWGDTITQNLANYNSDSPTYAYDLGPNGYNAIGSVGGTSPATSPVGSFAANGYGLSDMAGSVYEWCWDSFGTPYAGGTDPKGPLTGPTRMLRGGGWGDYASYARCARRNNYYPDYAGLFGFRTVLTPGQ